MFVVFAELSVDGVKHIDLRVKEDTDRQLDALHIAVGSLGKDLVLSGLNIVDDGCLKERELEIIAFSEDLRGKGA